MAREKQGYAVIDIDGVLADVRHRLHHVSRRPKDWDRFFAAAVDDPPLAEGIALVRQLAGTHRIVYLTGRPFRCRQDTLDWLAKHDLPSGRLLMRRPGDFRPARVTKLELLRRLACERPVTVLVDDDIQVVEAARAAGFQVLHADWMESSPTLVEAQEREGRT
ncbi:hypothetical protein C3Y87_15505 [Carbonactinospora thermoautotrophica]|uniref:phosphatase domain-containing protein n=1 Tax=Carbonactinospora thermoautotrophica TaxID=1469144 RepID=UPI00226E0D08|nr:hypothetical protein [Carbonactinospora thermoautotrophica]MCX9192794.1 hypothetical protein [Carbonactinospora thermoautotrophica]